MGPCAAGVAPPPQPLTKAVDVVESARRSNTENLFMRASVATFAGPRKRERPRDMGRESPRMRAVRTQLRPTPSKTALWANVFLSPTNLVRL